jgi:nucleoside-diphosphate-sugar epimerase
MDAIINEDIERIKKSIDPEPFRGKSVLVSGGSGFLGSWICDVLSQVGSRIICLDNLSTGVFENELFYSPSEPFSARMSIHDSEKREKIVNRVPYFRALRDQFFRETSTSSMFFVIQLSS